jgi:hypothetical protein
MVGRIFDPLARRARFSTIKRMDQEPFDPAEQLRIWLRHNDEPCPICGYNLRHMETDRCPECGRRFTLRVGAVDMHFGYFLAFLAPAIFMAGLAVIFWVMSIVKSFPPAWGFWVILAIGTLESPAIIMIYRKRKFFLVREASAQLYLAIGSWLFHVAGLFVCLKWGS